MIDEDKTKKQRTSEVAQLNQQIAEFKTAETKRKRGQRLPLESEVRFNTFADLASDCVFLFDSELNCVEISKAALRLFPRGTKEKDVVGKHLLDISLGLKETGRYNKCLEVLETGIPFFDDIIIAGPKFAGVRLAASVFRVNNGLGIAIKFATDIEKLVCVEKELSEAEEWYRSLVENTSDVVYILDDKAVVTYVSPAIESILGYSASEIIGRPVYEYIYQEDWQLVIERFRTGSFPNIPGPFEFRVLTKSGEVRWVRNSPRTLIKQNRLIGYQGVLNDITDSKRALEDLKCNEQHFRALIENALDAIVILNPDATIRYESPSMARMTGRKAKGRIGKNPLDFCHPDDIAKVVEEFTPLLENKIPVVQTELRLQHKNGEWRNFEVVGTNLIDNHAVGGIVLNVRGITERKRVEELLQRSEEQFRTLVETMNDGLAVQDPDGVFTFVNDKLCQMMGYASDELIGHTVKEILDEVNRGKYMEQIRKRRKGVLEPYEIEFIRKDGSRIISRVSPQLITDAEGNVAGSFGITTDITEHRRVEEALRESEERFRALTESTSDFVWEVDLDGVYTYASPKVKDLLGYKPKEILGKTPFDFMPPEEAKRVEEAFRASVESRTPFAALDNINMHKDGRLVVLETSGVPFFSDDGRLCGYRGIDRDITERKRAVDALQESEERFRSLVENAPYMIIIADREGKILFINYTTSGYSVEDTIGTSVYDYISFEYHDKVSRSIKGIFKSGEPAAYEITGAGPDGTTSWYSVRLGPIKHDGHVIAVTLMVLDITEHKRAEEELRESDEKIRNIFEAVSDAIVFSDLEGHIVDENEAALRIQGYSRVEEVIGKIGFEFIAEEDRARAIQAAMKAAEQGYGYVPDVKFVSKDGIERDTESTASLVRDASGNPIGFVSSTRDITERKKADQELRESEERLRAFMDSATEFFTIWDSNLNLLYTTERETKEFFPTGPEKEDLIGKNIIELAPNIKETGQYYNYLRVIETGKPFFLEETVPDPMFGDHCLSIKAFKVGEGMGLILTDITERKRSEEELRRYSERLRAMAAKLSATEEEERRCLAQELHDQVGQYVTALSINLSRASTQLPEETAAPVRSILDDSQSIVEQMSEVIRDIMADLRPPVIEDYGLVAAIRWYADRFASRTGINVTVQGEEPSPRLSSPHESALFRIAQEVLTNVAKHAQATKVSVNVAAKSEKVRLVIKDDGIGFDTAEVAVSNGQRGWGLVIMSERVRSMGGSFNIESRPGHGTRVIVEV